LTFLNAQNEQRKSLAASPVNGTVILDGKLDDADWQAVTFSDSFRTIEPVEDGVPTQQTAFAVLAHSNYLLIGIECRDTDPAAIVRHSKLRDSDLSNEDHVRMVIDPFLDGQSGLIFGINANGSRYDALATNRGESENSDWDAIWEAKTVIHEEGWTAEIRIPVQSISFDRKLTRWGFNVERRIQRNQETARWENIERDQWFIQTSRVGLLTNLPKFRYGAGLSIRPSAIMSNANTAGKGAVLTFDPSIDISQRIGSNITASLTVNTDFAETEVDTRQTNLTRFPLLFPEKRSFFLEGADIFEFGFGLDRSLIPFFSRRIGLHRGQTIPVLAGLKVNGRLGKTAFGALAMRNRETTINNETIDPTTVGVVRARQNVLRESSIGFIGTFGDPLGRANSRTGGIDFTYQTTRFQGNKNFLVGLSAMLTERDGLSGDRSAFAVKVDYPNDIWDIALSYTRIGEGFDPSLGFVPRKGTNYWRIGTTYAPRPNWKLVRQMRNQLFFTYYSDLNGNWESYRLFTAPINWRLESGDRIEANFMPQGEHLMEPFEIVDDVIIPSGEYHFNRYRLETELAAKRKINGQLTWWFGDFYNGTLDQLEATVNFIPGNMLAFESVVNHNIGRLPYGDFDQTLVGLRTRFNASPDLQLNSFVQYDTRSKNLGINARLHWIFHPQGDIFLVFNHNTMDINDRWEFLSQQILLKIRYNFRL
jgi:hypothetical protein